MSMTLTDSMKQKIDDYVRTLDIDYQDLDSYRYDAGNNWGFRYNPDSPEESWDEDEELKAQYEEFMKYLESDNLDDYIDIADELKQQGYDVEQDDNQYYNAMAELNKQAIDYMDKCIFNLGY